MGSFIPVSTERQRVIYNSRYESCYCLLLAIIARAKEDALGMVEKKPPSKQQRADIVRDAVSYFNDDRYEWHMELLGLDPEMKPDWGKG